MAPQQAKVPSFDDFIKNDRQRRKNSELAEEIFNRRRKDQPEQAGRPRFGSGPSLASRVGVAKASQRSSSGAPKIRAEADLIWTDDTHHSENDRSKRARNVIKPNAMSEKIKSDLLSEALLSRGATNQARIKVAGPEISIRGAAGPYVVIASNFATGTTAADIEAAMVPREADTQGCNIVSTSPTVVAEMVFVDKPDAESVINRFNNKKADGRILHVYMKVGGPSFALRSQDSRSGATATGARESAKISPDLINPHQQEREQSDRNRRKGDLNIHPKNGAYAVAADEDAMEVEDLKPPTGPKEPGRRDERPDSFRDTRGSYRSDLRYEGPRDQQRSSYYDRNWNGGRSRDDHGQYGGSNYADSRSRGYR